MQQENVIAFFNRLAPGWDADMERNEPVIAHILDIAGIVEGVSVLDVGCGTGVLIPDYLERGVTHVTGVDISPEMVRIARSKFCDPRVTLIAADVEKTAFSEPFDRCVVYNAFPHFPEPARLIGCLAERLAAHGRLTIAHGMSRKQIDAHHSGSAKDVSMGLPSEDELSRLFSPYFVVDAAISDDTMYLVSGVKR